MGHSSLTLYIQLFLSGYGLELSDLEALRTWGSRTPGHPEVNHTPGVERTTGPLGQGVGNAVGMAMAARRERGLLDPDPPEGESVFDHRVWAFASDGNLEEGVSSEASSLAGTQELGTWSWSTTPTGSRSRTTPASHSLRTSARYEAYGWHVQHVDDGEDLAAVDRALASAQTEARLSAQAEPQSAVPLTSARRGLLRSTHGHPASQVRPHDIPDRTVSQADSLRFGSARPSHDRACQRGLTFSPLAPVDHGRLHRRECAE
jgi:transketolase